MKKILLILLLFFCFNVKSQNNVVVHVDKNGTSYNWKQFGQTCNGCPSFFMAVYRTNFPDQKGLYYFYVYFYSNSFYNNGTKCSTYLNNINIYALNESGVSQLILGPFYLLVKPKNEMFDGYNIGATLYSTDPAQVLNINVGQINIY